jgi:hypothetical protein
MSNSFVHVAHAGGKNSKATNTNTRVVEAHLVEADEGDPSWTMVLADGGVSPATILQQHDIAEECMKRPPTPVDMAASKQSRELACHRSL